MQRLVNLFINVLTIYIVSMHGSLFATKKGFGKGKTYIIEVGEATDLIMEDLEISFLEGKKVKKHR